MDASRTNFWHFCIKFWIRKNKIFNSNSNFYIERAENLTHEHIYYHKNLTYGHIYYNLCPWLRKVGSLSKGVCSNGISLILGKIEQNVLATRKWKIKRRARITSPGVKRNKWATIENPKPQGPFQTKSQETGKKKPKTEKNSKANSQPKLLSKNTNSKANSQLKLLSSSEVDFGSSIYLPIVAIESL